MELTRRFRRRVGEWGIRGGLAAILLVGAGTGVAVSIGMAVMSGGQLLGSRHTPAGEVTSPSPSGAVAAAVAAGAKGGSTSPSTPTPKPTADTQHPTITARTPGASAVDVPGSSAIRIVFSEPVRNASGTTIQLANVAGGWLVHSTVRYDAATRTATLTPDLWMYPETDYRVTILPGITDRAGNRLTPRTWTFRIGPS